MPVLKTPERLDTKNVEKFLEEIKSAIGKPTQIDATDISYIGALGMQTLILAQREWEGQNVEFRIDPRNEVVVSTAKTLGFELSELGMSFDREQVDDN